MFKSTNNIYSKKAYLFIILIAALSLLSCNQNDYKTEKENIETLEKEIALKDSTIVAIINEGRDLKIKAATLQNLSGRKYIKKDHYSFLLKHKNILTDKESVVRAVIEELSLETSDIMPQLFETYVFNNYGKNIFYRNLNHKSEALVALWNNVDRSPEAIKSFLTENDKLMLVNIFKNNTIYKDSGLSAIAQSLLTSYEEIEASEQDKQHLYNLKRVIYEEPYDLDDDSDYYTEARRLIQELTSEQVNTLMALENYSAYQDSGSELNNRLQLIYTFWARRLKENNKEEVYHLIKELHEGITE